MNDKGISILKKLMEDHKHSPYDLADISGITQPTIHRFLTGQTDMNSNTARKIAAAYKITVSQLRGETPLEDVVYDDETKFILDKLLSDQKFKAIVGTIARMNTESISNLKSDGSNRDDAKPEPKNNGTKHSNGAE